MELSLECLLRNVCHTNNMTTLSKLCSMQMCAYCTDITDSEYTGVGCFIHVLAT